MTKQRYQGANRWLVWAMSMAIVLMPLAVFGQTKISYHSNKYKPADDVRLGRQAAAEAEQQFPLLRDSEVNAYVERVGQRLVAGIPSEFQHPEFRYYFRVVNARDINAFALPGGPMYVNRGMIEAARTEGEMAGVMAHELSHVALRHGTAQATKAQKYAIGAGIAGILGTILAGPTVGQLAQLPVGVYFLKFSREYETEADLLGARIMANAGYDPRDLANVFRTLEAQGGGGGGFLSDHPSPTNRYQRINQEAQYLAVQNRIQDDRQFFGIKERLRGYPRAQTMAEIQRSGQRYPNQRYPNDPNNYPNGDRTGYPGTPRGRVEYPSSRYRSYNQGTFSVSVPDNWRQVSEQGSIWFAPDGAYGAATNGQATFTHGVSFGMVQTRSRNLQQATNEFINGLQQSSGSLRARTGYQRMDVDGRSGLLLTLGNTNEATGRQEVVNVVTTQLRNGELFYMIAVSPDSDYGSYQNVFLNILRSVQLND
ncbi:MAG TPA: M48 family metallopeptidase [Pyrinomonadaceae bacterium]|nr:M48 family metallopeptidase [Pyrinomonadaceae bacterium]